MKQPSSATTTCLYLDVLSVCVGMFVCVCVWIFYANKIYLIQISKRYLRYSELVESNAIRRIWIRLGYAHQFICNIFVEVIVQPLHTTHLNAVYLHFLVQSIALYPTIYVVWCSCVRNPHFIFSFSSFCIVIWNEVRIWSAQKINLKRKSIDQKWREREKESEGERMEEEKSVNMKWTSHRMFNGQINLIHTIGKFRNQFDFTPIRAFFSFYLSSCHKWISFQAFSLLNFQANLIRPFRQNHIE